MKVLPEKEFKELATRQEFTFPERLTGFIDKETYKATVPMGARTRTKLHELGHEKLGHFPKTVRYFGKGRKDIQKIRVPWVHQVDEEIEAELYSYRLMGKRVTPRVGMMALEELLLAGWEPHRALSLVIGRLRKYGIETSWKERIGMAKIVEREREEPVRGYEDLSTD